MNRLQHEKSPYLLQHAENPVDWFPWCAEAFEKARREQKPVLVSIGYSTCHWCHVMAHESFEDSEVAGMLNRYYVAVKVDREERPDIDAVYMAVCQAMTGAGGWPLTIVMTPEQKPFFAATYLPKNRRYGQYGFLELLDGIARQWEEDPDALIQSGEQITAFLQQKPETAPGEVSLELLRRAVAEFKQSYDPVWGGFGRAPKFPSPHQLLFLLRYHALSGDQCAGNMALHTLSCMNRGGLFDQIGGGFSRYATDNKWLVPHFEKMLYDNALLLWANAEAYRLSGNPEFRFAAAQTADYVQRELTGDGGGFFCGQDADSGGKEGLYYTFSPAELHKVLGEGAESFCRWYNIAEPGNFEGKSIPNRIGANPAEEAPADLAAQRQAVYEYRRSRISLPTDDKVLAAWNGMMIVALAYSARLLDRPQDLAAAQRAMVFLRQNLLQPQGRLLRRWRDGKAGHPGLLDDYAFYGCALLSLYELTFDPSYLWEAAEMGATVRCLFFDTARGGCSYVPRDSEPLIAPPQDIYDNAAPSGNTAAARLFCGLADFTGEPAWRETADLQLAFLAGYAQNAPTALSFGLLSMTSVLFPSQELICTSPRGVPAPLADYLRRHGTAGLTVWVKTPESAAALAQVAPFTAAYPVNKEKPVYYLCQNGSCNQPEDDWEQVLKRLKRPL